MPPGIAASHFSSLPHIPAPNLRVVTVSRLSRDAARKNVDGVLHALAQMREPDITYTVIGDGDDLPRLQLLAAELGIAAQVRFLGEVPTERVSLEFARSDLFILAVRPDPDDIEGFGMVYAEAAAAGLPSIGTRSGGIPDVVEHGKTGLLLDDVSSGGIAAALREAGRLQFDRASIRESARRFSAEKTAALLLSALEARLTTQTPQNFLRIS